VQVLAAVLLATANAGYQKASWQQQLCWSIIMLCILLTVQGFRLVLQCLLFKLAFT
jgi:hypothetical protein